MPITMVNLFLGVIDMNLVKPIGLVAVFLMLASMFIYVISDDEALTPSVAPEPSVDAPDIPPS